MGLMSVFAAKRLHNSNVVASDLIPERVDAARMVGAQAHADAGYAQIAAHEMGISPELLSHTAASPVLAAIMSTNRCAGSFGRVTS